MSRIMELAQLYRDANGISGFTPARLDLETEVTRMEEELETVLKDRIALAKEIDELRAKLAALEAEKAEREKQEAVEWRWCSGDGYKLSVNGIDVVPAGTPLYLYAGARTRVPMNRQEMADMFKAVGIDGYDEREKLVRAVESFHKIGAKNGAS
jgi:regulator of replication initiation timing